MVISRLFGGGNRLFGDFSRLSGGSTPTQQLFRPLPHHKMAGFHFLGSTASSRHQPHRHQMSTRRSVVRTRLRVDLTRGRVSLTRRRVAGLPPRVVLLPRPYWSLVVSPAPTAGSPRSAAGSAESLLCWVFCLYLFCFFFMSSSVFGLRSLLLLLMHPVWEIYYYGVFVLVSAVPILQPLLWGWLFLYLNSGHPSIPEKGLLFRVGRMALLSVIPLPSTVSVLYPLYAAQSLASSKVDRSGKFLILLESKSSHCLTGVRVLGTILLGSIVGSPPICSSL